MKIILVRHGDAGAYTLPDNERQLSKLGNKQALMTGQWLSAHYAIDAIIASPYRRAMQTAQAIQQFYDDIAIWMCHDITPNDDVKTALASLSSMLERLDDDAVIVVVCHMSIIVKIQHALCQDDPPAFDLAEARILDMASFTPSFGHCQMSFVPNAQ